jgi:uncharacterized protein (DUF2249 family)/iron-sulfur cluster repair protein YtfE (RIC family)
MSQPGSDQNLNHVDEGAAHAVVRHHAELAAGLHQRVEALLHLVDSVYLIRAEDARQDLLAYLRGEVLPHAAAEEDALYPAAAAQPGGSLLIQGMSAEHAALAALVAELADTASLVRAAAAARALAAMFATHLVKENDLVLPLLITAPDVSLAAVLAGMHELLGADAGSGSGSEPRAGGCGGGGCGCGGDQPDASADAPLLSVDSRLDVREVEHDRRHALVVSTVAALSPGDAVVLVASHAPRPVLAEIGDRFGTQVRTRWLQSGPEVWQVRLERVAAA